MNYDKDQIDLVLYLHHPDISYCSKIFLMNNLGGRFNISFWQRSFLDLLYLTSHPHCILTNQRPLDTKYGYS